MSARLRGGGRSLSACTLGRERQRLRRLGCLRLGRPLDASRRVHGGQRPRLRRRGGVLLGAHRRRAAAGRVDLELHAGVLGALKQLRALRAAEAEAAQVEQLQGGVADGERGEPG